LHAREVLQQVCPEANLSFSALECGYGEPVPPGLTYPLFIKPVKAAFSVLAATIRSEQQLHAHTRFGAWELWVIRHLVEPFEEIARQRLPQAGTAHRLLLEEPMRGSQYNLDGYVFNNTVHEIGIVQALMYPGTEAFLRFDYPSGLQPSVHDQAMQVARKFLQAIGFSHGMFNMEFFHDAATGKLTVIEFNPRMAPQFSDLYRRVDGVDLHRMALELAWGRDPGLEPCVQPVAGAASSFVYRIFDPAMRRDFKWLGSYRYAIIHLGGADKVDLRQRCERASGIFGWPAPYADIVQEPVAAGVHPTSLVNFPMETSR